MPLLLYGNSRSLFYGEILVEIEKIEKIIDEEYAKELGPYVVFKIRERIFREVAESRAGSDLSERRHNVLCAAISIDRSVKVRESVLSSDSDANFGMSADSAAHLLYVYESCQKLCEFLMDEYEDLSEHFKANWKTDQLITVAAYFSSTRDRMYKEFVEEKRSAFDVEDFKYLHNIAMWACVAIFGEEKWCYVAAEAQDAMKVFVSHPKFVKIIGKE